MTYNLFAVELVSDNRQGHTGLRCRMPSYLFVRLNLPPAKWELLEVIKHPRIAEFALSEYEKILGDAEATEIRMVIATSEMDARRQLPSGPFVKVVDE